jgi:hypothetical protein
MVTSCSCVAFRCLFNIAVPISGTRGRDSSFSQGELRDTVTCILETVVSVILGFDLLWFRKLMPTFLRNMLSQSSGLK